MSSKRPLAPRFLNRLDHYLLINRPEVWSARTHLVAYYGLLFIAALTILSFLIPDDPRSPSPIVLWVVFLVIISILALIGWLIYLLRFNVFKRYGNIAPFSRLVTFMLYFVSAGIIILFPFVMPFVESIRANKAYGDQVLVNDINDINMKLCQLEYDSLAHNLKADTIIAVDKISRSQSMGQEIEIDTSYITSIRDYHYRLVDTASLAGELSRGDSSIRVNDSMYVLYSSYVYEFIHPYAGGYNAQYGIYTDFDLYNKVIRNFRAPDRRIVKTGLYKLLNKYRLNNDTPVYAGGYEVQGDGDNYQKINIKYDLSSINRSINNIAERKYRWRSNYKFILMRMYYYSTLIITLLVFIYRHSTRKTFFLSLLTGILLTIFTSLVAAYFIVDTSYTCLLFIGYTILFFVISLFGLEAKTRQVVTGIALNLFVLMVVLFPLSLVNYHFANHEQDDRLQLATNYLDYESVQYYLLIAELAGSLLLLILLATYIQTAYRKWYALPEE